MESVKVVARRIRRDGKEYETLYVRIPRSVAKALGIKSGEKLVLAIKNIEINGRQKQALVYYKSD